jgi:hypothetical protein
MCICGDIMRVQLDNVCTNLALHFLITSFPVNPIYRLARPVYMAVCVDYLRPPIRGVGGCLKLPP